MSHNNRYLNSYLDEDTDGRITWTSSTGGAAAHSFNKKWPDEQDSLEDLPGTDQKERERLERERRKQDHLKDRRRQRKSREYEKDSY